MQFFLDLILFSLLLNEDLPMLDHVGPAIGFSCPVYFITGVFRCSSLKN